MPIQYEVNEQLRLKTISFSDRVTEEEFVQYSETLSPANMRDYDVAYVDLSQMTDCDFGFRIVSPHAGRTTQRNTATRPFKEIIFAPSDVAYGMARMYQTLVEEQIDVELFREETEAQTAQTNSLNSPEPA